MSVQEERDLVPYVASPVPLAQCVLVLAPHPDDEVFGCGGSVRLHVQQGAQVEVAVVTDGAGGGDPVVRAEESRAACAILGTRPPMFWGLRDRGLGRSAAADVDLARRIEQALMESDAEVVYAPSPWEVHPDHRAVAAALARVLIQMAPSHTRSHSNKDAGTGRRPIQWRAYEVGVPLWPTHLVDITPVLMDKQRAMAAFDSQFTRQDYLGHVQALNRYRTYTLSGDCQAAEAFWVPSQAQLHTVWADWAAPHRHPGGALGGPADSDRGADRSD